MARLPIGRTVAVTALVVCTSVSAAQRGSGWRGGSDFRRPYSSFENQPYDGRFVFVRMSYPTSMTFGLGRRGDTPWAHDYPDGERHFLQILTTVSNVPANLEGTNIMGFDDPEIFRFPVIYLVEPGHWELSETGVETLGAYLRKGGFLIVDDFPYWGWQRFASQFARVFPDLVWQEIDVSHPIFHSFFDIETLDIVPAYPALGDRPIYLGLFENNDPTDRMYAVANFQNDLSEFWEFSASGEFPIDRTNEAYKVGVNQFIYGMTR